MCTTCGCGNGDTRIDGAALAHDHDHRHVDAGAPGNTPLATGPAYRHLAAGAALGHRHADGTWHRHAHDHGDAQAYGPLGAAHAPGLSSTRIVQIEEDILAQNNAFAAANRRRFADRGILALNLVSGPGSGKTTLLVRTIAALAGRLPACVIEGDQQTSLDAERIRATGARAVQLNTGKGCHLDAHMVGHALESLDPPVDSLVLIENVGNLVCPAAFDLGEAHKVVILSVTEGDDKPLKYPDMFHAADLMVINKVDLLPYVEFDVDVAIANARRVRPGLPALRVSATTGLGMADWIAWIDAGCEGARTARDADVAGLRRRVSELEARLAAPSPQN